MLKLEDKFIAGKIRAWNFIDFLLAKDTLEYSNTDAESCVSDVYYYLIKRKVPQQLLDVMKNNLMIVLAHWKSDERSWKIYYDEGEKDYVLVEDLISYLPYS